jgi:hypothetical protein
MPAIASSPTPSAVAAASAAIGGAVVPLGSALERLGWPYLSRSSIHARLLAGTLPVTPRRLGGRWVVYAMDAARLFEAGAPTSGELPVPAPSRRGPGRPRKVAYDAGREAPWT